MPTPRITVCTPVYNLERYVAETLESIAAQVFTDFEVLVIDDGSTDNSAAAVKPFLADPRFRYIHQENAGVGAARNHALRLAQGEWFAQVDGDDLWLPNALQVLLDLAHGDPAANVAYANSIMFREDGFEKVVFADGQMREGDISQWLYKSPRIGTVNSLIKTESMTAVGGYVEHYAAMEDYDLWIRLAQHGIRARASMEVISRYRVRMASKSADSSRTYDALQQIYDAAALRDAQPRNRKLFRAMADRCRAMLEVSVAIRALEHNGDASTHLRRSVRYYPFHKKVVVCAMISTLWQVTRVRIGRATVLRLLRKAMDVPWQVFEDPASRE